MTASTSTTPASGPEVQTSPWDRVSEAGVGLFVLGCIVTMAVLAGEVIPPLVIIPILFLIALAVRRSRHRAGTIALVVIGVLALVGNAPFVIDDLTHAGDAPLQFAVSLAMLVGIVGVLAGAIGSLRSWAGSGIRPVLAAAAVIVVAGAVAAGAMSAGSDSDVAQSGDVTVEAEDIEFAPERVTVASGGGVFVDNADLVRHTFTIESEAIDVAIPAGRARRVDVDLPAGTYEFTCEVPGHEDMKGTLVVE